MITSIVLDKETMEYKITYKDEDTGKATPYWANHLTEAELKWRESAGITRKETENRVIWC